MNKNRSKRAATGAHSIAILGVIFDNVTTSETIALIEKMVASRLPHYLATANVDFLVQALHDVELRRILMDAHLVLCDGTPLLWASRFLGNPLPERVAGSDLVPLLIQIAEQKKYRIYFLGGTPKALAQAVANLKKQFPHLIIAGFESPPFQKLIDMDHQEIKRRIQEAKPDLLFVSFGCPKQEKWIAMHYRSLGVPVSIGVGATIDFLAGTARRAPKIMRKTGTEWTFRLMQEPRRLLRRYIFDLWWFGRAILKQWWKMQFSKGRKKNASLTAIVQEQEEWRQIQLSNRLDVQTVQRDALRCEEALSQSRYCLLELNKITFIDSTGMGLLIRLQKKARVAGRHLILVAPSSSVQSALRLMRLREFFSIVPDLPSAHEMMKNLQTGPSIKIHPGSSPANFSILWQGEITATNADEIWKFTEQQIAAQAQAGGQLRIDLSALQFIDSSGLGVMVRARKNAAQRDVKLSFTGIQPNVRNVLRMARLESVLLGESK
ncbi:MAG: WecB/TagA/CpsF family glycosyltransferase [Verrucomicrobiota bacterium]|nr:WecB/TagA/CpsF family glycosyltransferase [Verrucomicrobiota bacterium]